MLRALKVRLIFTAVVIGKKSLKWFSFDFSPSVIFS